MLPITELAGRYHLEERIAVGGMGEVWRAVDQVLGRPVAVKLLRPEYLHDELTLLRFRAEAQHAGLLNHPGIAQVYDYQDATPEQPAYLVMELVNGPSLAAVLAGGELDPRRTADVLAQAAEALHAAHTAGVLHRDIKPGNLLLAGDGRVKVTDFGIAQSSRTGHFTRTGSLIGTVGYLAPERVAGNPATAASDLYALGIVGYECLAGQPPFRGEQLQVALAHRDQDLPGLPPSSLSQPGGPGLAALIADLTAKDPAARPASGAVVAERARRIRNGQADSRDGQAAPGGGLAAPTGPDHTTLLSAPPPQDPPGGPRRRRLAPAGFAVGIVAAGLLGWLVAAQGHPAQSHPAQGRQAQPRSTSSWLSPAPSPARSEAPARAAVSRPTPSSSPERASATSTPAVTSSAASTSTSTKAAGKKTKKKHSSPGRTKHGKGPPPGHG